MHVFMMTVYAKISKNWKWFIHYCLFLVKHTCLVILIANLLSKSYNDVSMTSSAQNSQCKKNCMCENTTNKTMIIFFASRFEKKNVFVVEWVLTWTCCFKSICSIPGMCIFLCCHFYYSVIILLWILCSENYIFIKCEYFMPEYCCYIGWNWCLNGINSIYCRFE